MSETKGLLEKLDGKVSELLSNLERLKSFSDEQSLNITALKTALHEKDEAIEILKKENEALKKEIPTENQEDLKFKIGEMVKEIDRCISLLKV